MVFWKEIQEAIRNGATEAQLEELRERQLERFANFYANFKGDENELRSGNINIP